MAAEPNFFFALDTTRLKLRCVQEADAASIAELMTPTVSQTLGSWPTPFTFAMATQRIADMRKAALNGDALPLSVEQKHDPRMVGWVGVERQSQTRKAKLGYWIGESFQGKGYATEAVSAAIAAAFELLAIDTTEAAVEVENTASISVLRRCGMLPAGERMVLAPARGREYGSD